MASVALPALRGGPVRRPAGRDGAPLRWVRGFGLALTCVAGAVAGVALTGHLLGRDLLAASPGSAPLNGNTALALCLLVAAVICDGHRGSRALGAAAAVIGGVTLAQYLFSVDLGVDRLVFPVLADPAAAGPYPGRMAVNTAIALTVLGTAFVVPGRIALALGLVTFLVALVGGAAYTDPELAALAQIGRDVSMALPTALTLAFVSIALVVYREQEWFARESVGGTLVRRAGPTALILPLGAAAVLLGGARNDLFSLATGAWLLTVLGILFGLLGVYLIARTLDLQQERATAALSIQAAIADNLFEGVSLRRESDGRILSVNPALERMFGYEAGSLTGTDQALLSRQDELAMSRALAEERSWTAERRTIKADGETFWCSVKGVRFDHPDEGPLRLALYHDVTERVSAQAEREALAAEREAALKELQRSNDELEQFAHVASHDLSEPLRVIGGFVGLLQRRYEGRLDHDADRYIGATVSGVERMQALIDALLTYARVGSGEVRRSEVETAEIASQAVAALGTRIEETGAHVEVGPLPTVAADPDLLAHVFQNLIANSLKFTGGAPPRVEISARRGTAEWVFAVADNGIGIDPKQAERVFGMFQRLHGREVPGTGIGLPISRRIAERHGGRIWIEPRAEGGSVVSFSVPDAYGRYAAAALAPLEAAPASAARVSAITR